MPDPATTASAPQPRDTIVAIATPPGRGGIGIVRLSGPDALSIATPLLRLAAPLEPARARFCEIIDPDPDRAPTRLDEAIVTFFRAPRSYTGEDVLEIAAHGSPVLLDLLLRQLTARGARLAHPGEFTERAFLSGRLDLTQAEAVRDLIDAQTLYQARIAASQLDGALSRRVRPLKDQLIRLIALLEAGIDFAEDDTPVLTSQQFAAAVTPITAELAALEQSFTHGRLVHSGLTLAILGAPNVGKSSLFNRLVERERAIVTAEPGTTRDLVSERISLDGIPVELIDTAGLRDALDEAERLGIEKSREALADADLVLFVLDAPQAVHPPIPPAAAQAGIACGEPAVTGPGQLERLLASLQGRNAIVVLNKADLLPPSVSLGLAPSPFHSGETSHRPSAPIPTDARQATGPPASSPLAAPEEMEAQQLRIALNQPAEENATTSSLLPASLGGDRRPSAAPPLAAASASLMTGLVASLRAALSQATIVATSALTGDGLTHLRQAIRNQLQSPTLGDQDAMLTNLRQHQAVHTAHTHLAAALAASRHHLPHEMLLLDLYTALTHLDHLTGETTSDDILNLIFSTFCIGK